jgi:hypothetical protein
MSAERSSMNPQGTRRDDPNQAKQANSSDSGQSGLTDVARNAQDTLKETAQETLDTAKQAVQQVTEQTQQQVGDVVTQTVDQASHAVSDIKEEATSAYIAQRDRVVESLTALASALKTTSQNLTKDAVGSTQNGNAAMALGPFVEEAADRISQSADFLRDKDMSGLMREAQTLAKKQPLLFLGAMFGVGIAGARMFKGMSESGGSSSAPSESGNSFSSSGMGNQQSGAMNPMAQRPYDDITNQADRGSASISSYGEMANTPDAMPEFDEMPAGAGATSVRPRESRS